MAEKPKTVQEYLEEVDYSWKGYVPSKEALMFVNFIKEVNAGSEENETPVMHLAMMDNVFNTKRRCLELCFRGSAKTSLFGEYLILYIAAFGKLPGFGRVDLMLYVSDSIENGVKNLRRNVEFRFENSEFLQKLIPKRKLSLGTPSSARYDLDEYEDAAKAGVKFTDIRLEFVNYRGDHLVVKGYGASAIPLDSMLHTESGYISMRDVVPGDRIYGANGKPCTVTVKSEVFNRPMYKIRLSDGRNLSVCEEHINSIVYMIDPNNSRKYVEMDIKTMDILDMPLYHTRKRKTYDGREYISNEHRMYIRNIEPIDFPKKDFPVDPYTLGLLLGDGSCKSDGSNAIHAHKDDVPEYISRIPYKIGSQYLDKRNNNVVSFSILEISDATRKIGIAGSNTYNKRIPEEYFFGSIDQRFDLLSGLLDTDGTVGKQGRISFTSVSEGLADDVSRLVRSLGGTAKKRLSHDPDIHLNNGFNRKKAYKVEIWHKQFDRLFKLERKKARTLGNAKRGRWMKMAHMVPVESITDDVLVESQCIAVDSDDHQYIVNDYFRTHNTGVRGTKELGQRPTLAVLDDIISDEDARSPTVISTIENTVYKAVSKALAPSRQKIIWLGTPFNANDPIYKAVESGAWNVSVYPVCEHFDSRTTKDEFVGAWEDRFSYEYVKSEFDEAMALGRPSDFYQELMLQITSEEARLVPDSHIMWYNRDIVLENKEAFNWYITTDFASSTGRKADFSVISVWAYGANNDWFLVDGWHDKVLFSQALDRLFDFASMYKTNLLGVGVEISAQQKSYISIIQEKQIREQRYFTLATNTGTDLGIRPASDKFSRFNQVQPLFANHKVYFPNELKNEPYMVELLTELRGVDRVNPNPKKIGSARHDDILDTISMLTEMSPVAPTYQPDNIKKRDDGVYMQDYEDDDEYVSSYSW